MAQEQQNSSPERRTDHTPRRRRRRRSVGASFGLALLYVVCVIGISILLACVGWIAANDVLALNKEEREITLTISQSDEFEDVVDRLEEEGLIEYKLLFKIFASVTHKKEKVTPGTYILSTNMDYRALLAGMSANSANKMEVKVTIPEGYTVDQIFTLLEENGVATVADLEEEARTHDYKFDFLQDIPLGDPERLEGYLYPDTYTFYTNHNTLWAINKLLANFDTRLNDELRTKIEDSGYSLQEILTIASLIEKETDGTDRRQIASVIYNRLDNPGAGTAGYLQIDATLAYLNGGKVPTEADKSIDSPYNTYLYQGLPPGPIANPGMESIYAALDPAHEDYYYYALGDDDVHHYFKTYDGLQNFLATQERYQS